MSLRLETVITNGLTGDTEKLRERQQGLSPAQTILHQKIDTGEQPSWVAAMKGNRLVGSLHTQEGPTFHWYPVCLAGF